MKSSLPQKCVWVCERECVGVGVVSDWLCVDCYLL